MTEVTRTRTIRKLVRTIAEAQYHLSRGCGPGRNIYWSAIAQEAQDALARITGR